MRAEGGRRAGLHPQPRGWKDLPAALLGEEGTRPPVTGAAVGPGVAWARPCPQHHQHPGRAPTPRAEPGRPRQSLGAAGVGGSPPCHREGKDVPEVDGRMGSGNRPRDTSPEARVTPELGKGMGWGATGASALPRLPECRCHCRSPREGPGPGAPSPPGHSPWSRPPWTAEPCTRGHSRHGAVVQAADPHCMILGRGQATRSPSPWGRWKLLEWGYAGLSQAGEGAAGAELQDAERPRTRIQVGVDLETRLSPASLSPTPWPP